jgi:hypothetical protein
MDAGAVPKTAAKPQADGADASAIIARTNWPGAFALPTRLPDGRVTRRCPQAGRTIRTTQISKTEPMKPEIR